LNYNVLRWQGFIFDQCERQDSASIPLKFYAPYSTYTA